MPHATLVESYLIMPSDKCFSSSTCNAPFS
jgi:hypothetical protein